jgi:deoxyribodipyrimidine photo-lyase
MIDACMRYLHRHRWINFRMRAMLMSFAAYHLWLHWREPALFLAKSFLDFEPGIHFPQVQMQSGVTGINTVRIYSPVKQAMDQDPNGEFVRSWIPELEHVPKPFIFEPWKMSIDDQTRYRCRIGVDYPVPIVDHRTAVASAKDRIYLLRRSEQAIFGAQQVYEKHGSRKNRDPLPKKRPRSSPESQLWLPGMEE